jgi:hypothetical protein
MEIGTPRPASDAVLKRGRRRCGWVPGCVASVANSTTALDCVLVVPRAVLAVYGAVHLQFHPQLPGVVRDDVCQEVNRLLKRVLLDGLHARAVGHPLGVGCLGEGRGGVLEPPTPGRVTPSKSPNAGGLSLLYRAT